MGEILGEMFRDRDGRLSAALVTKWLFALLLVALCIARALGVEVETDLLLFVAITAGVGDAAYVFRRGRANAASAEPERDEDPPRIAQSARLAPVGVPFEVLPVRLVQRLSGAQLYTRYNAGGSNPLFVDRNYAGQPCPPWAKLPANVKEKWEAVAEAAAGAVPDAGEAGMGEGDAGDGADGDESP